MTADASLGDDRGMLAPVGDADATEFWAALEEGVLLVSRCGTCEKRWLPPLATCPRCGSWDVGSTEAPATASLYSWTVIHLAVDPVFAGATPYVVGLVELPFDDGPARLYGRIVGVKHDELRDGLELRLGITRVNDQPMWFFTAVSG
jgi:uncharacterized OB-fold protein